MADLCLVFTKLPFAFFQCWLSELFLACFAFHRITDQPNKVFKPNMTVRVRSLFETLVTGTMNIEWSEFCNAQHRFPI